MKALFIALSFVTLLTANAHAQKLIVSPLGEKTVAGWQYGGMLSYKAKSKWSMGGFYQTDGIMKAESLNSANTFYGLTVSAPLAKSEKINFYFTTRVGLANQFYFVAVPGLETELRVSDTISISTLMSVRMTYPSAAIKLNIAL